MGLRLHRRRASESRAWPLRRQLVVVVGALLVAVCAVLAASSALALRAQLVGRLDTELAAQSNRSARFPGGAIPSAGAIPSVGVVNPLTGAPDRLGGSVDPLDGSGSPTPAPTPTPTPIPTPAPGSGSATATQGPLDVPGLAAGTISAVIRDGQVAFAGYIDQSGDRVELTAEQRTILATLPADGTVRTRSLGTLGDYRVVATETPRGDVLVSAASLASTTATVRRYVAIEIGVSAVAVLLAVVVGMFLVRRSLRPLDRVAATATRVSELSLDHGEVTIAERVDDADTDPGTEVGRVGSALNLMLGHVEDALAARHESETQVRRFVADASHELRTPLASVRGYAELVRRLPEDLPDDAVRALGRIEAESLRMSALVDDMLLLAQLDSGRDLEHAEVDLVALAIDAVADAHVAGPDHVWRLDLPGGQDGADDRSAPELDLVDHPDDLHGRSTPALDLVAGQDVPDDFDLGSSSDDLAQPAVVTGDDARLRQVLVNLLSNARVHTPAGTTVTTSVHVDAAEVTLVVADDGPGIAAELQPTLFQRFTRGDSSRNRVGGSTGLGLAIALAVVQAHGGSITVSSRPGSTVFTVRLPVAT